MNAATSIQKFAQWIAQKCGATVQGEDLPLRVLVVDDDANDGALIENCIFKLNHTPHTVNSLDKASEALENNYDGVLLDIHFPHGNGIEFWEKLKTDHKDLSVVLISGALNRPELPVFDAELDQAGDPSPAVVRKFWEKWKAYHDKLSKLKQLPMLRQGMTLIIIKPDRYDQLQAAVHKAVNYFLMERRNRVLNEIRLARIPVTMVLLFIAAMVLDHYCPQIVVQGITLIKLIFK